MSASAGRVVGHARTGTELPVSAGSQETGSVWNSHDYSNGVGFAQIVAAGFAFVQQGAASDAAAAFVVLGVPLGIFSSRRPRLASPLMAVASIVQTIPGLALLALLGKRAGGAGEAGAADAAAEAARSADPRMNPRAFKLRISYPGFDFHPDFGLR